MIGGLEKTVGNTIWCPGDNKEKPYGDLPLIPIDFSKKMIGTVFEDDYKEEHLQNTVDNMNFALCCLYTCRKESIYYW